MTHPERYYHVSQTQMSIARHFGGMTVNGRKYVYDPTTDTLVRDDIVKREAKAKRKAKKDPEGNGDTVTHRWTLEMMRDVDE